MFLTVPAFAQNEADPNDVLIRLIQCKAVHTTLSHSYLQVAASMLSLRGKEKNILQPFIDSYIILSETETKKAENEEETAKEVTQILLENGADPDDLSNKIKKMYINYITNISINLSIPKNNLEEQLHINQNLLTQSEECEIFANSISIEDKND
jgi:hypothetical protein